MAPAFSRRLRDPVLLCAMGGAVLAVAGMVWLAALTRAGCWGAPPHAGCPPRADFAGLWGAGRLAVGGRAADAYDWPQVKAELERVFGVAGLAPLAFLYPPPVLLAAAAVGAVSYTAGFFTWTAVGLSAYAAAVTAVLRRPTALLVALAPAGAFFCAYVGQNGFLTAAALAGGLVLVERRPLVAGVLLALFACKPQLAVVVPVALVAGGRWRVLGATVAAYLALWALTVGVFGPRVLTAFLDTVAGGGRTFAGAGWVPWWKLQSLYGVLRGVGAPATAAFAAQAALAAVVAALVAGVWRSSARTTLKAAALAAAALIASPYAFVYDGPLLAVAALFLLRDGLESEPLDAPETTLLVGGLFGQVAFLAAPASLLTPLSACALLGATLLRVLRTAPGREAATIRA